MPRPISEKVIRQSAETYLEHRCSLDSASKALGIPRSTLYSRIKLAKKKGILEDEEGTNCSGSKKFHTSENSNSLFIESVDNKIKTVDDAIAKADIDLDIWEVEKVSTNTWEVGMKIRNDNKEQVLVQPLHQVKIWLRRKFPKPVEMTCNALVERIAKHAPKYASTKLFKANKSNGESHLLEISIFDAHFGKLAWENETEDSYDLKIAETIYYNAINDLISKIGSVNIEKILLPIGQDFFHIDNTNNTTINGTAQDVDTRYSKIFTTGTMAIIKAIDLLLNVAPVEVLYVPGNHDRTISWHLTSFIHAWYRNAEGVTVDHRPTTRKYKSYGVNLLGFTHGDEEKHSDLPLLMASESPQLWADSLCKEWHLGHYHKRKEMKFVSGDTYGPVTVRVLPSLSGTDAWHYRKGYVGGAKAAEAYLWGHDSGYTGHFNAFARLN